MKEVNINLLPAATRFELQRIKLEKRLRKAALIVVIAWLIILGLVVAGRMFFRFRLSQLNSKKKNISNAMQEFSPQVNLQKSLRLRVKLAADVLAKRSLFYERLSQLISYLPDDYQMERLELKRNTIKISASLATLIDLNDLEEDLKKLNKTGKYNKIELTSIGQDEFGRWNFMLEVKE